VKRKTPVILDASALLALIFGEDGEKQVEKALKHGAVMTAVNLSETMSKMVREGYSFAEAESLQNMEIEVLDVDQAIAQRAAFYDEKTKAFGLSLGDRICLAAGYFTGYTILTADKSWKKLQLADVDIAFIR
jgi:ribonuclease VapC